MIRFFTFTLAMILLSAVPLSPAATPPNVPETAETPSARSFRLAGFSAGQQRCRVVGIFFNAGPTVGDAELQTLIDPGFPFTLDLSKSHVTDGGIKALAKLSKMNELDLRGTQATLACLKDLTALRNLTIWLTPSQITADSAQALAKYAPTAILQVEPIDDSVIRALGQADLLHLLGMAGADGFVHVASDDAVTKLNLPCKDVSDASIKDLAALRNLTFLHLGSTALTNAGLAELKRLGRLTDLDLSSTKIANPGLMEIAFLDKLKYLDLRHTAITGAGLKYLTPIANLHLSLDNSAIDAINMREITTIPSWTLFIVNYTDDTLHALNEVGMLHLIHSATTRDNQTRPTSANEVICFKAHSRLSRSGFKELTAFKNLETLDLHFTLADDGALEPLAALEHLRKLNLGYTKVTDAGLKPLAAHKTLRWLNLSHTAVTDTGVAALQAALPDCEIERE